MDFGKGLNKLDMSGLEGWTRPTVKWEYKTSLDDKEEKMSLAQRYLHEKKSATDRLAIDMGVLNEDGTLTCEGKDFLLNLLLQDKDIRTRFDLALGVVKKEEE